MNVLIFIGVIRRTPICGVSMKNHLFLERFREVYDKVIPIDTSDPKHHPGFILSLLWSLLCYRDATIIISTNNKEADFWVKFFKRIQKHNVFNWVVGGTFHLALEKGEYNVDDYAYLKGIFVQSIRMEDKIKELGLNNVKYVPNSKRIDYYPMISVKCQGLVRFVFLSRIHPDKGCDLIISATKRLNELGYGSRFTVDFYGKIETAYQEEFINQVSQIDNINYNGFLDLTKTEGYQTLSSYDMMLFPTFWEGEGFPGVLIDAFIAAVPVLASDWHFNPDIIDETTGIIIPHHSLESLFTEMKAVIDGIYDVTQMSNASQREAHQYDNRVVLSAENLKYLGLL